MKQLIQNLRNGKTQVMDIPTPTAKPGTALVRVEASLVSAGTERMLVEFSEKSLLGKVRSRPDLLKQVLDKAKREGIPATLESAFNRLDQPMSLGYSSAGVIVDVGKGLSGFKIGDHVACAGANHALHAEFNVVPKFLLTQLPNNVDFESGAFTTLGSIALHGFRLGKPQLGESICVIGLGLLGLLTVKISIAAGCRVFGVDLDENRVKLARKEGIKAVLRPDAITTAESFTQGRGFDCVLICADAKNDDPINLAAALAKEQGRIVAVGAVGLGLTRKPFYDKELIFQVSRSYGPGRYDVAYEEQGHDYPYGFVRWTEGRNLAAFVDLIATGKIEVKSLVSHRFPIKEAENAYSLITGKTHETFLGVILTYPGAKKSFASSKVELFENKALKVESEVRLGVLGAGGYANSTFLPMIKKIGRVQRIAIVSGAGMTATYSASKFGFHFASTSDSELIHDKQINTIAILTRHDQHAQQVMDSLKQGNNVFCEKPLAVNEKELNEIQKHLGKKNAPILTVGFNRRFARLSQKLGAFLKGRTEPLIAHYRVNAGFLPLNHWSHDPILGGGRLVSEGCHFIDYLTFLVGTPPIEIEAIGLPDNGKYNRDNLLITLTFADGSIGSISYLANGDKSVPKEYLEVFFEGKVGILNDFRTLTTVQNGNRKTYRQAWCQDKGHSGIWNAFLDSILKNTEPPIPYSQIIGVHKATFAAVRSLETGVKETV